MSLIEDEKNPNSVISKVPEYQKRANKNYYEKIKNTDDYKAKKREQSKKYRDKMSEKYGDQYLEERRKKQREYYQLKKQQK
jgi:hypothetical protein